MAAGTQLGTKNSVSSRCAEAKPWRLRDGRLAKSEKGDRSFVTLFVSPQISRCQWDPIAISPGGPPWGCARGHKTDDASLETELT